MAALLCSQEIVTGIGLIPPPPPLLPPTDLGLARDQHYAAQAGQARLAAMGVGQGEKAWDSGADYGKSHFGQET